MNGFELFIVCVIVGLVVLNYLTWGRRKEKSLDDIILNVNKGREKEKWNPEGAVPKKIAKKITKLNKQLEDKK
jgi:hypothetical protein